jgi:hypothetical protein
MSVTITGQYATLSRGRIVAKHVKTGQWGERGNGTVTLDRPGKWMVSQTDGFSRKETIYVEVSEDGTVSGLGRRMEVC